MTFTEIQAKVTKTAAFTGSGLDVSGITGDWTIKINVSNMTAAKKARFSIEDTVNDWTASVAGPTFSVVGALGPTFDKVKSFKKADFPDLRVGTASAQIRLKCSLMDASASSEFRAWIEY